MTVETEDDVVALKRIGKIVASVLQEMLAAPIPGEPQSCRQPVRKRRACAMLLALRLRWDHHRAFSFNQEPHGG